MSFVCYSLSFVYLVCISTGIIVFLFLTSNKTIMEKVQKLLTISSLVKAFCIALKNFITDEK